LGGLDYCNAAHTVADDDHCNAYTCKHTHTEREREINVKRSILYLYIQGYNTVGGLAYNNTKGKVLTHNKKKLKFANKLMEQTTETKLVPKSMFKTTGG